MKLDKQEISKLLDITAPFLMLDEAVDVKPGGNAHCVLSVSGHDWFMKAHLPSVKMMPGTLLTESMLQSTVLILYTMEDFGTNFAYVNRLNVKLLGNIQPPAKLDIFAYADSFKRGMLMAHAEVKAGSELICKGEFSYACPHLFPCMPSRNG